MECEIKLALDAASVSRVKKIPLLRQPDGKSGSTKPEAREHVDRYFDTADFTLWQHGFALRVRSSGTRHVQTLKGGGSALAGLHQRVELEAEVASDAPDRALFARQLREALPALAKQLHAQLHERAIELEPVFVNRVKRASWMLELADGVKVECALDTGELQRGDHKVPVRELELEMKEGDPAQLYELARQVHEAVPVRIENVSKAERGYALAGAVAPRAVKAAAVLLPRKASMGEALAGILRNCLEQMQANEQGVLAGDAESLHQMRVGLRRLRAALAMVRKAGQARARLPEPLSADIDWLAGELGDARNWDVFIGSLLPGLPLPDEHKPAMARVEVAAREEAERHRSRVRAAVGGPRYTTVMLGLGAWIAGQGWKQAGQQDGLPADALEQKASKAAPRLVQHAAARVRKRARQLDLQRPEGLHKVRIAAKKERYAREFFAALAHGKNAGKKGTRRHDLLSDMQDELGLLNDSVVARALVAQLRERVPQELALLGFIEGVLAARAAASLPRAGKHVRRKLRARAADC